MKPVEIVRISHKIDKRAMLLDLVARSGMELIDDMLAPVWKNLDSEYVKAFLKETTGVRFVCAHRSCPTNKTVDITAGMTISQAKQVGRLGFFTVGGALLVPFIDGNRVEEDRVLQGGEIVEYMLP